MMSDDTIVTCWYCRAEIPIGEAYAQRNGAGAETFECQDEDLCRERFEEGPR